LSVPDEIKPPVRPGTAIVFPEITAFGDAMGILVNDPSGAVSLADCVSLLQPVADSLHTYAAGATPGPGASVATTVRPDKATDHPRSVAEPVDVGRSEAVSFAVS
jgi:hypothetical protein